MERAWDKHRVPKPFTTFVVSYGEPISVPRNLNEEEFEQMRLKVEGAMLENRNRAIKEAERILNGESK